MPARIVATRPKVATHSANHCAPPVRAFCESSISGSANIRCAIDRAGDAAGHLSDDIERRVARGEVAFEREDQRHRRVEMRAGNRAEDRDEHDQNRAGRQRVAEQGERHVLRQVLRHDAGTDDGRDEKRGAERLRRQAAGEIEGHRQPAFLELGGRAFHPTDLAQLRAQRHRADAAKRQAVKTAMRFRRYLNAVTNAASF